MTTNSFKYAKLAKYLSTQAIDDSDYYIHNNIGYNFRLASINAALCISQLKKIKKFIDNKKTIYETYKKKLSIFKDFELLETPSYADNNHWQNVILCKKDKLKKIIKKSKLTNIQVRAMWLPNHIQKPYMKFQSYRITNANNLKNVVLCIPSSSNLTKKNINKVVSLLKNV